MKKFRSENEGDNAVVLSLFREKRKWQIALRRYVIERNPSAAYAPFFGLDIENMRRWFEYQFSEGVNWGSFGKNWQFDHIIPVSWFDFSNEEDLKLCWNFANLRVGYFRDNSEKGQKLDLSVAKAYFRDLFEATSFPICGALLGKAEKIEQSSQIKSLSQQSFIQENQQHLKSISSYGRDEFELLNQGRTVEEVNREIEFARRFGG